MISPANYSVETKAGILAIEIGEDGTVFMEQQEPTFSEVLDKELIARSLYISSEKISQNLPVQIISTSVQKPSKILAQLSVDGDKITKVFVGGGKQSVMVA